ncbi:16828_t:CDS:2, partial [Funneliformis geosporum]
DLGLYKPVEYFQSFKSNNIYGVLPFVASEVLRGRSFSLLTTQKTKKQNTTQTVDTPPTQQTIEPPESVVLMKVNPSPSKKGKEKETLEETPEKTTTTIDVNATALSNKNLTIDGKHVICIDSKTKLYAICSSPNHKANGCPRRRKSLADRNMQNLYQRFQLA